MGIGGNMKCAKCGMEMFEEKATAAYTGYNFKGNKLHEVKQLLACTNCGSKFIISTILQEATDESGLLEDSPISFVLYKSWERIGEILRSGRE